MVTDTHCSTVEAAACPLLLLLLFLLICAAAKAQRARDSFSFSLSLVSIAMGEIAVCVPLVQRPRGFAGNVSLCACIFYETPNADTASKID